MAITNYGICNFNRVVISSTCLKFSAICDILGYQKFF
jgi:hypothetical protein